MSISDLDTVLQLAAAPSPAARSTTAERLGGAGVGADKVVKS